MAQKSNLQMELDEIKAKLADLDGFCRCHPKLTYGNTQKWQQETIEYLATSWAFFRRLDVVLGQKKEA